MAVFWILAALMTVVALACAEAWATIAGIGVGITQKKINRYRAPSAARR